MKNFLRDLCHDIKESYLDQPGVVQGGVMVASFLLMAALLLISGKIG